MMRRALFAAFIATMLGAISGAETAFAASDGYHEVTGVDSGDMLKMRAGPGTGYRVIVGLPNGAVVRIHNCDQIGGTQWCQVSLKEARGLKGYVSWHYLQER